MMVSAGSIIEGAFRLIRERPMAVAIWGLLYMLSAVGMTFVMRPVIAMQAAAMTNPQLAVANMPAMFGRLFLMEFAILVLFVVLMTAAQRAVLRPGEQGFAYLRIGMDELRMLALALILIVLFYVGFIVVAVVLALVVGGVAAAAGGFAAVPIGIVAVLLLLGALVWLEVRLSLAFPLTLLRRKIVIGESWRITRGRFWTLFAAYFAIFLIVATLSVVVGLAATGSYIADMIRNAGNPEAMQQVAQAQMARQFGSITLLTVIGWILSAIVGAVSIALGGGAVATAVRELVADEEDIGETFA
jgi:hypothetical protein